MEKCERCKRGTDIERRDDFCSEATIRPLGVTSTVGERECAAIARVRAPLDAEVARLTAEVATLRARLEEAEARWRSAERQCNNWHCEVPGCPPSRTVVTGNVSVTQGVRATWSPADRDHRCTEHTTREGAEETKR